MTPAAPTREQLLQSIADTIKNYRLGEIPPRTPADVDKWVRQFSSSAQEIILAEIDHALSRVYISREDCEGDFKRVVTSDQLARPSPAEFWSKVNFLRIQTKGESQRVMLALFEEALKNETGLTLAQCGSEGGPFIYLDDCIFTATHVRWDIIHWLRSDAAPKSVAIYVIALAMHRGRANYTRNRIVQEARTAGKEIAANKWMGFLGLADSSCNGETDCLQPTTFPQDDPNVQRFLTVLARQGYPAKARSIATTERNNVFSSEENRRVLEEEFLKAGARIKYQLCPQLPENQWPLGYDVFKCVGFGSLVVTYRNCPNNGPLAFWAGDPWFPLFPRKTNTQSAADVLLPDDSWPEQPQDCNPDNSTGPTREEDQFSSDWNK